MLDALARYAEGFPGTGRDDLKALERFSLDGLKLTKAGQDRLPELACFEALQRVLESRQDNALPRAALLEHAAAIDRERVLIAEARDDECFPAPSRAARRIWAWLFAR
mgnify:CR=1 FL=1